MAARLRAAAALCALTRRRNAARRAAIMRLRLRAYSLRCFSSLIARALAARVLANFFARIAAILFLKAMILCLRTAAILGFFLAIFFFATTFLTGFFFVLTFFPGPLRLTILGFLTGFFLTTRRCFLPLPGPRRACFLTTLLFLLTIFLGFPRLPLPLGPSVYAMVSASAST